MYSSTMSLARLSATNHQLSVPGLYLPEGVSTHPPLLIPPRTDLGPVIPTGEQIYAFENITFPQLRWLAVKNRFCFCFRSV